jgi:hypothetical protein
MPHHCVTSSAALDSIARNEAYAEKKTKGGRKYAAATRAKDGGFGDVYRTRIYRSNKVAEQGCSEAKEHKDKCKRRCAKDDVCRARMQPLGKLVYIDCRVVHENTAEGERTRARRRLTLRLHSFCHAKNEAPTDSFCFMIELREDAINVFHACCTGS